MHALNVPVVLLGMGMFEGDGRCSASLSRASRRFIKFLERRFETKGGFCALRGVCSQQMLAASGISTANFPVLGCPSLFINRSPDLGQILQRKYNVLLDKLQSPNPSCIRIGVLTLSGRLKGDVASLCVNISGSAEHVSFYVISAPHRVRFTKKKCERVKERGM